MALGKIGFIGCGKMAQSLINGMIEYGGYDPSQIISSAATNKTIDAMTKRYGIQMEKNNKLVASTSDVLFLAVKPYKYAEIMKEIVSHLKPETLVVTAAFGISLKELAEVFTEETKIVRIMPNTPSFVGEGMTAYAPNRNVTEEELHQLHLLFESFGKATRVDENLMDAITAVSGSSPAYVYVFIEAMADGAVRQGIPRDLAYQLIAQSVFGAAKMVMETGKHPGALKDEVTTPNGTTIRALASLEADGFRGSLIKAISACFKN